MSAAEVLAVEVRQYIPEDVAYQALVPRLIGQTEAARQAKGRPARRLQPSPPSETTGPRAEMSRRT